MVLPKICRITESTGDSLKFLSKGVSCLNCNFRKFAMSLDGGWIGEQGEL